MRGTFALPWPGQKRSFRRKARKSDRVFAYEEMVIMEAEKISKTVQSEYDDVRSLEIIHSKGVVNAGELSLWWFCLGRPH
jgi:molybdopterin synthase catalytic subunit